MPDRCDDKRLRAAYQAYLIRLWQDGADSLWRSSTESVQSGEIQHFASLTELFAFLEQQTDASGPGGGPGSGRSAVSDPTRTPTARQPEEKTT